jgi:hypothetical protein
MRKHLVWISSFLCLAFGGDRLAGYFLKKITDNSQFRYSRLYNSTEDADILFVGNSRGLTFFQPEAERLTKVKTMNLSYNGMPADLAKCLVMDYLDHHKPPKLMIVDVTLCDRENDVLKSGFNLYTPKSMRLDTLLRGMTTGGDDFAGRKVVIGGNVSHLYRYNSEIFQRVLYHRNKTDEDWLIDRVISEKTAKDTALSSYKVRMFPNMADHFKEMIDYAKSKGVEVKLVINPYFPAFAETSEIKDSFLIPLKTHIETLTGLSVHDFSTALTEIDEIGDLQHANKKGSIRYMNILLENGILSQNTSNLGDNFMPAKMENVHPSSVFISENTGTTQKKMPETIPVKPEVTEVPPSVSAPFSASFSEKKGKKKKRWESDYGFAVDTLFSN